MNPDFSRSTILYGGSFDPPHLAHLQVAIAARKALPDSQLFFVPCKESPGKPRPVATDAQRVRWLEYFGQGFGVWETELQRNAPSYTIDTLKTANALGATPKNLYWLVGSDAYGTIPRWRDGNELRKYCRFLVVQRPQYPVSSLEIGDLIVKMEEQPYSSSAMREQMREGKLPEEGLSAALKEELGKLFLLGQNPYGKN